MRKSFTFLQALIGSTPVLLRRSKSILFTAIALGEVSYTLWRMKIWSWSRILIRDLLMSVARSPIVRTWLRVGERPVVSVSRIRRCID